MTLPALYLSRPGVALPATKLDNDDVLAKVRANYRGDPKRWSVVEGAIRRIFAMCQTRVRYLDEREEARVADYAVDAVHDCLQVNATSLEDVDTVLFGGIARQYFEPATATEIAARLGLTSTHALDVTSACVGHLEAVQVACGYLSLHDHYRAALVTTSELAGDYLSYDIQAIADLHLRSAGLTIGNGAASLIVRRTPWPNGGLELCGLESYSEPAHWDLCQVPIKGTLMSSSTELMRLSGLIVPRLRAFLDRLGWDQADHYVFHQPSELMVKKIVEGIGDDPAKAICSHHLYGNTASASVGLAYRELLAAQEPQPGAKIVLGSAAAGFSMVVLAGRWHVQQG
ncbi:MAG: hypothetical protein B7733_04395 [Myxococcales bacterium FL481]|nr:MAG: hypothetical protein B7733_04395 [Myxococcales bacterium FL481]